MEIFKLWRYENRKNGRFVASDLNGEFIFKSPHKNNNGKLEAIWAKNMRSYISWNEHNRGYENFKLIIRKCWSLC